MAVGNTPQRARDDNSGAVNAGGKVESGGGGQQWRRQHVAEDHPAIAVFREEQRDAVLSSFARFNAAYGEMQGNTKTAKSCRKDGMKHGLLGIYARVIFEQIAWQQLHEGQIVGGAHITIVDPVLPAHTQPDPCVCKEFIEAVPNPAA